jgi:hypothetical protein
MLFAPPTIHEGSKGCKAAKALVFAVGVVMSNGRPSFCIFLALAAAVLALVFEMETNALCRCCDELIKIRWRFWCGAWLHLCVL